MSEDHPNSLLVRRYWAAANARDWLAFEACLDPDVCYRVPQTREIVRGRAGYLDFNISYPGDWTLAVESVIGQGRQAVSRVAFSVDGTTMTGISFFEIDGGLITAIDDFWPEPYEPPARQSTAVQRY